MIAADLSAARRILCLGAHCDDIEIGCGGTLLTLLAKRPDVHVDWVVFSSDERRAAEARTAAEVFLARARTSSVAVESFRGRFFPFVGAEIKEYFDGLGRSTQPDLVFTHNGADLHQDHRLLSELSYNTFRDHLVLEYEIPKWDGDLGRPSVYVHVDAQACETKVDTIFDVFESQQDKHWFTKETFRSLMRLRGIESKAPDGYAEAFYCRKVLLG